MPLAEEPESSLETAFGSEEPKLVPGTVAYIQLLKIIGQIMDKLYGVEALTRTAKERIVSGVEIKLREWVNQTPSFSHPDQVRSDTNSHFYNIP